MAAKLKSDVAEEIGVHAWELAGLGKPPYKFVSWSYRVFRACPDAPAQAGATCQFCGHAIMNCCEIKSADGKEFIVGCDCVERIGEKGIVEQFKTSPEYRKHQEKVRREKAVYAGDRVRQLLNDNRAKFVSLPHPYGFYNRKTGLPLNFLDYCEWMLEHSGDSGIVKLARRVSRELE